MRSSIKTSIINHVCYRDVFSAPVYVEHLKEWIGISDSEEEKFKLAIDELVDEKLIECRNGLIAVYGKQKVIDDQQWKDKLTDHIINKRVQKINWLFKLPFIRYIGISGSLAANNPTMDRPDQSTNDVDLDLFVVCSKNTIWIFFLFERLFTNFVRIVFKKYIYCFNYVTEESFLEVHNKNFYTATEINNLKTIYDNNVYNKFLSINSWYNRFYVSNEPVNESEVLSHNSIWSFLAPINILFFVLFCCARAIKKRDLSALKEITGEFNPNHKCNLQRISNPYGGYQQAIKERFIHLYQSNFSKYYNNEIVEDLFPSDDGLQNLVVNHSHTEYIDLFSKYSLDKR